MLIKTLKYFTYKRLIFWIVFFNSLVFSIGFFISINGFLNDFNIIARIWKVNLTGFSGLLISRFLFENSSKLNMFTRIVFISIFTALTSGIVGVLSQLLPKILNIHFLILSSSPLYNIWLGTSFISLILSSLVIPLWLKEDSINEPPDKKENVVSLPNNTLELKMTTNRLNFREQRRPISISLNQILFIEARGKRSILHTNSKQFILSENLASIENRVSKEHLIRIHKSYMVNFFCIKSVEFGRGGGRLFLNGDSDEELPIGRKFEESVRSRIQLFR